MARRAVLPPDYRKTYRYIDNSSSGMSLIGEPIVILGTFRGGTSCLATALVAMGLYMGEPDAFQKANEFNKGGFWELEDMQALNAKFLVAYGMGYLGAEHMQKAWE